MEIINNEFTVTFKNTTAATRAKEIAKGCLLSLNDEIGIDDAAILAADSLVVNKTILAFEECCFFSEELIEAAKKIVKAIAFGMKAEDFEFSVYGSDSYTSSAVEGNYQNGELSITTTFYPEGYVEEFVCPECDEVIVSLNDYDPSQIYICPECGEELDFSSEAPVIEHEVISIC